MQEYGWTWRRGRRLPPGREQGSFVSLQKSFWSIIGPQGEKALSRAVFPTSTFFTDISEGNGWQISSCRTCKSSRPVSIGRGKPQLV
jgi:hypothetical protein